MSTNTAMRWIKSTYSDGQGGACVEWAPAYASAHGVIPVRDSKSIDGATIAVSRLSWSVFVDALNGGEFRA